jgi:hypothetical protein
MLKIFSPVTVTFMFPPRLKKREWCKNKSAIENGQKSQKRLPGGGKPVRYKEIDNKLMAWFREKRDGFPLFHILVCLQFRISTHFYRHGNP